MSVPHPIHVALTVNAAWNAWNFRRPVIEKLMAEGHSVTIVAPEDDSVSDLIALGCGYVPLPMKALSINPLRDLALLLRMRQIFAQQLPDVILGYTIKNNIYGALAARSLGIPFIPNVSGLGTAFLSGGAMEMVARSLYRVAFAEAPFVFFQNADDRTLFVKRRLVRAERAMLVPGSGIDLKQFAVSDFPVGAAPPTFLLIGRMLRDKGVGEYAEAARIVKQIVPSARFLLLGGAGAANRSAFDRSQIERLERSCGVEYLGITPDVRPHIAKAHCIVLPSYREGAPRTLIEAAAMARPIIATDVAGCRDVVEEGITGLFCRPRDAEDLARACLQFLGLSRGAQQQMGMAGRAKIEREFDQALVVAAYERAIKASI